MYIIIKTKQQSKFKWLANKTNVTGFNQFSVSLSFVLYPSLGDFKDEQKQAFTLYNILACIFLSYNVSRNAAMDIVLRTVFFFLKKMLQSVGDLLNNLRKSTLFLTLKLSPFSLRTRRFTHSQYT